MFLKSNKILILLALALLFSETNCHASRHNKFDEEHISSKMLRKLSDVFTCLFGSCKELQQNVIIRNFQVIRKPMRLKSSEP